MLLADEFKRGLWSISGVERELSEIEKKWIIDGLRLLTLLAPEMTFPTRLYPEILRWLEITPAMLDAGVCAFAEYDCRFEGPEENVRRIYLAMERARKR
jgi:hypothetical protein